MQSEYNRGVDVLIIPEAGRELAALRAFRPGAGTWGALIGRRRGPRYFVEKVIAAGNPGTAPDERLLAELEKIWPDGVIGVAAVRPGAAFRGSLLGPAWYGKLLLKAAGPASSPVLEAFVVEFERRFFLAALPLAATPKE